MAFSVRWFCGVECLPMVSQSVYRVKEFNHVFLLRLVLLKGFKILTKY